MRRSLPLNYVAYPGKNAVESTAAFLVFEEVSIYE